MLCCSNRTVTNNTFYFRHDYNAMNDEKILMLRAELGAEAYGVYWMILESMAMASDSQIHRVAIGGLSLGYGVAKERLEKIVDFCVSVGLLKEENGCIFSARMQQHKAIRESLQDAGRRGAAKRWSVSQQNRVANGKGKGEGKEKEKEKEKKNVDGKLCVPTPAQISRDFFTKETTREEWTQKIVTKGIDEKTARLEIKKFVGYWTERNKSGTKQKWEMERAFELPRRLATWLNNSSKFSPTPR